jgi:hypothetical protein
MHNPKILKASLLALAFGLAACSQGSDIASPGGTGPTTPPTGGGGGGGTGGGGTAVACPTGTTSGGLIGALTVCNITGEILTNFTLPEVTNVVYRLNGRVDVGRDSGPAAFGTAANQATLTIQPGVRIFGDSADDLLIVNRGSRISAIGSRAKPIIFTARSDIEGTATDATTRGWGGVIVLGRAPIRACNTAVARGAENCQRAIEGVTASTGRDAIYGGNVADDNSGTLAFVQIRYPGAFLPGAGAGDDLNGLTLGGVGSGTTIENLQVHNSGDDGIEWFGGTVNARNLVVTGALDDSLDMDAGFNGSIQFVVVRQSLAAVDANGPVDRLVESSNLIGAGTGTGFETNPTVSNFTFIGVPQSATGGNTQGIRLDATSSNVHSSGGYFNGVVTGSNSCAIIAGASNPLAPRYGSILFDCPAGVDTSVTSFINPGQGNNTTNVANSLSGLLPGPTERARTAINPTTLGSFFRVTQSGTGTPYIGAFAPDETATDNWTTGWTFNLFPAPACPTGTSEGAAINGQRRCILSGALGTGSVPANLRLVAGNVYEINGRVDVGTDRGGDGTGGTAATLTIEGGVTLFGDSASDLLIVNRGSQIFVNGTPNNPVIMTSLGDVTNPTRNDSAIAREWAGLIVLGRAPIRACNTSTTRGAVNCQRAIEGVTASTGRDALYGGDVPGDSSGRINYLQIRYPGAFLPGAGAGDDLNGLTLGGVGSGTEITGVQVHNSGDDGIEWFGGTVNSRYLIVTGALDDSLDMDAGFTGAIQFAIVRQSLAAVDANGPVDRLVESSNLIGAGTGTGFETNPIVSNFTFIGVPQSATGGSTQGIRLDATSSNVHSSGGYFNGVVTGSSS